MDKEDLSVRYLVVFLLLISSTSWAQTLGLKESFDMQLVEQIQEEEQACKLYVESIDEHDMSEEGMLARIAYYECLQQITLKQLAQFEQTIRENPDFIPNQIAKMGQLYQAFNVCQASSDCAYHGILKNLDEGVNILTRTIVTLIQQNASARMNTQRHSNPWNAPLPAQEKKMD